MLMNRCPLPKQKMKERLKNEPSNECKTDESPNTTHPNKQMVERDKCSPLQHPTNNKTEFKQQRQQRQVQRRLRSDFILDLFRKNLDYAFFLFRWFITQRYLGQNV